MNPNKMRKFGPRTIAMSALISVVVIIALSIGVAAAVGYSVSVQHQATGVSPSGGGDPTPSPTYTFELYNSDGVTPLVSPIVWGNVTTGTTKTLDLVVKNTGNQTFGVVVNNSSVPSGWTLTATEVSSIAPNNTANMTVTIGTSVAGSVDFTTDFQAVHP